MNIKPLLFSIPIYGVTRVFNMQICNIFKLPMSREKSKDFYECKRHHEYNSSLGL